MGRVTGKVAFITGAGRGQGRSHAVRLAEEGADIVAVDRCADLATVPYPLASQDDLEQTADLVRAAGGRVVVRIADVRDQAALRAAVAAGAEAFGGLDIVVANAGIAPFLSSEADPEKIFRDVLDVNLIGTWNTIESAKEALIERGGGSIVVMNSTAGLRTNGTTLPGGQAYIASKHALVGLVGSYAHQLAEHGVRVNGVHPTTVDTPMINNPVTRRLFGDAVLADPGHLLPVSNLQPVDVSNAVLWLASDEARYVTGISLPVDAGFTAR
jgi:SDR family mycofactocin-dependent oxidoreductase